MPSELFGVFHIFFQQLQEYLVVPADILLSKSVTTSQIYNFSRTYSLLQEVTFGGILLFYIITLLIFMHYCIKFLFSN